MYKFPCQKTPPVVIKPPRVMDPPKEIPTHPKRDIIVGIVVGHNEKRQGATNFLDESEWVFNKRIAYKLQAALSEAGIKSFVVFRPKTGGYRHECSSVAKELVRLKVTHAICLHFNSAGKGARGCEVLIPPTHTLEDDRFADILTDILNEEYGFYERAKDGIKTVPSGHNGFGMLDAIRDQGIISVLPEPAFGDYETPESRLIFRQEDKYVDILKRSVVRAWIEMEKVD